MSQTTPEFTPESTAATPTLPPQYTPADVEAGVAERWEQANAFHAEPTDPGQPYSIVIPPPNVTAALHLGHALNNTIQDILTRAHRMKGFNTVWLPGTDHAGIATQSVVDKRLQAAGEKSVKDYKIDEAEGRGGREQFIEKVQSWKDEYEQRITEQLQQMGCSCDWQRQAFTMDDTRAKAVREAFFQLFKDGLIYRGKRLVNWDPVTQTALANDEVEMQDVDGQFYYMRYPICDAEGQTTGEYATVATTRPETMLGDTAVAVNPKDDPRAKYIGQFVKLPIVGRVIPIIGDDYVVIPDAESDDSKARMASGFLKVTPAHDPNDYDIGKRHDLPIINIMAPDASISHEHGWLDWDDCDQDAIQPLLGLSREDARRSIVRWFKENDLLADQKPYRHAVGHSYRSHAPIEPYLSDQWYVKVTDDRLAGAALRALEKPGDGHPPALDCLAFTPSRYEKTFRNWHENIRDWCISRQLWWGHRIPVWSGEKQEIRKAENAEDCCRVEDDERVYICLREDDPALIAELEAAGFIQDPDVLDTWFSSALWPMSTMGWPQETAELETWNPTSVLCTAREIITLWVSRMVMFNLYFLGRLPFRDVFIHAMIQDGHGQKMSKSLGNGVDPADIIHSHGADAMRFTLASMTTHTQDVRMPVDMVDPRSGDTFTPTFTTGSGGVKVAAPIQEYPPGSGKKMVSSYGLASGQAAPNDEMPLARNTSEKFDLGQRFANKLWNATRFALQYLDGNQGRDARATERTADQAMSLPSRWVLHRLHETIQASDKALAEYRFADLANGLYDFFWRDVCDWYIEAIKPTVNDNPQQRAVLAACIDATLRLLHPVMPFITERLWTAVNAARPGSRSLGGLRLEPSELLVHATWPISVDALRDDKAVEDFDFVRSIVSAVREVRAQHKVPPQQQLTVSSRVPAQIANRMIGYRPIAQAMANYRGTEVGPQVEQPANAAAVPVSGITLFIHDVVDSDAERQRLEKRQAELNQSLKTLDGRLSNTKYTEKAPAHLVQQTRDQREAADRELQQVKEQLEKL
jgi:valyl-tRNA synthetase